MRIRNAVLVVGVTGTLVMTQLVGSALADPKPDAAAQAKQLLAAYTQTNQKIGACMRDKGLSFDARLAKADIADAFNVASHGKLTDALRDDLAAQAKAAPDDPNASVMGDIAPSAQAFWADAVNECDAQVNLALSGGPQAQAKVKAAQRAALETPEVKAAARAYVKCMQSQGFAVDLDPFVAPQQVSVGEHSASDAAIALVDTYNSAWSACVAPWQQTYDQKLFG